MSEQSSEIFEFTAKIISERYYNNDSAWGVYNFTTQAELPYLKEYQDPFQSNPLEKHLMSSLVGKMQQLYIGSEYKVKAKLEYNSKYNAYQYTPISIISDVPKTFEAQREFLKTIISERLANNLLAAYPNIVEDVMSGEIEVIDYSLVNGVQEYTWNKIKNRIIDNYVISDIIIMLQPLGVTYNMIKKLLSHYPNPSLLKEKLDENPYIMTAIPGLGFKRVDGLALKLKPELIDSMHRLCAYVNYFLHDLGDSVGSTYVRRFELEESVSNNVQECYGRLNYLLHNNTFLHIEPHDEDANYDCIGLEEYYRTEMSIKDIVIEKNKIEIPDKFIFSNSDIENAIIQAEKEQGFNYTDEQKRIITEALKLNVAIISGKAGTGKTSISKAIFIAYQNKGYKIAAMAFSAKAAQRITEASSLSASTIHRALGTEGLNKFLYNHENPLPYDVIYVDEVSMIPAGLFYNMLCAIGETTRIILSGDHKQLPPIGYGNVFCDILERKDLFDSLELTKVMRQAEKSGILCDANMIRDGENPVSKPDLKVIHGELRDLCYMFRTNRQTLQEIAIKTFLKNIEEYGLDEIAIVTPRRQDCINSAFEINKIIQEELVGNEPFIDKTYIKFHKGAKVMQTANNYDKNVFNGEIGYIVSIDKKSDNEGKVVETAIIQYPNLSTNRQENPYKIIEYTKNELDQIDLAYALTTHKMQGSGYKYVIGIIDSTHYSLLNTSMLYTMLTRAKGRYLQLAEPNAFIKCIKTNGAKRNTWLSIKK